mmetsp:Transcript_45086/g.119662  ORF Transcript_45086/g.119662 Transcript_45086/m.119662 type:complete len:86 (-) Transcript_45086:66-323(-)
MPGSFFHQLSALILRRQPGRPCHPWLVGELEPSWPCCGHDRADMTGGAADQAFSSSSANAHELSREFHELSVSYEMRRKSLQLRD